MLMTVDTSRFPLYIFDLDGTLSLADHRRHLVEAPWVVAPDDHKLQDGQRFKFENGKTMIRDPKFKPEWDRFYQACEGDQPNWPVIGTFMQLYSIACDVRIWSGREDSVRGKSLVWLHQFTKIPLIKLERMLQMRPTGDYTPDHQLKRKWLNALSKNERARLTAVFDDRKKVVDMWRGEKVACFQVAEGDF
jgi:hypothetical protein